jgi:iron complex outermembrane receptor protein
MLLDVNYFKQQSISSADWGQSSLPVPGTGVALGSSATPTTRSVFYDANNNTHGGLCPPDDTNVALCDITANGVAPAPGYVQSFPGGFHQFDGGATGDRFNFAPYNLLLTPSDRKGLFSQVRYHWFDHLDIWMKGLYESRESVNQAAPEPIFIGPGAGTGGLADHISVDASNPYNPFGQTLDANSNFVFAGRRPLEGGPRVFTQNVETRYLAAGLTGDFSLMQHVLYWDANLIDSRNRASQTVHGTYNIAHIARALGPVADCTAPCVPLNFFGGPGTITPDMLNYIAFVENDHSLQGIDSFSANVSGGLFNLPAGSLDAASGIEYRRLSGEYAPDSVVTYGETNGVPSLPTSGTYNVKEWYLELHAPVLADLPAVKKLDVSVATRYSDYSTFGSTWNSKFGLRWQPIDDLTARMTWAEGFRAPSVGELFGSPARFDATLEDPCSGATDAGTIANCHTLGTPSGFHQANTQISVRTGGNAQLQPETAKSLTAGLVYSPAWAVNQPWSNRTDFEWTFYHHHINDAIQAIDAQTQLDRCVATLDPAFCNGITRGTSGDINGFDNTLKNLGTIKTEGYDFTVDWVGPTFPFGRFGANWSTTYVFNYEAVSRATGLPEPATVGVEVTDSAIPRVHSNLRLKYGISAFEANWTLRYISGLTEACGDAVGFPTCSDSANGTNHLGSTVYNDLRVEYTLPIGPNVKVAGGVNNVFDQDPPVCVSCSLNGYDASTYDLPGRFTYVEASVGF